MPRSLRNARKIVVAGHTLYWTLVERQWRLEDGEFRSCMRVSVFARDGGTSRLEADIHLKGNVGQVIHKESDVTPSRVAAIIQHALAYGWDPTAPASKGWVIDADPILSRFEFPWIDERREA